MNDDIRERLSAYLDGALPDAERRAVELEISRSEELRLELEALRAVSAAVKGLPKEKLPAGFRARLESRIAREKPERSYFILPPAYRPAAFALSSAIVALFIYDKNNPTRDLVEPQAGWETPRAAVKSAGQAPSSVNMSERVSSMGASADLSDEAAKKDDEAKPEASTFGKHLSAPGKPLGIKEEGAAAPLSRRFGALSGSGAGGAAPAPAPVPAPAAPSAPAAALDELEPQEKTSALIARNEEERSAINERLYKGFEEEKKRMGIAKIIDKNPESDDGKSSGQDILALQSSPEAPALGHVDRKAGSIAAMRGAKAKRESAPAVRALVLRSADALYTAWAAAGLPGDPPAVKFPEQMALFLAGPAGCGITDVQQRRKLITVLYKDTGFEDASARVRAVPLSAKPVVVKPAQ